MDNHILVVEDDAAIREGVRILLEGEGYIVQEAEDGYQCLKKVSLCPKVLFLIQILFKTLFIVFFFYFPCCFGLDLHLDCCKEVRQ